jgi:hypothetical protein|uniref:Uncharacterized protein n=1 Tax=uncultured prokaryote TaxID=198431 RepID=A0A0H5Q2N1_9ZZZZ|nr:hypothetical protein [uncultured prokaryote]
MAVSNTNLLELLGKQVSFSWLGADGVTYNSEGELTSVVFHLHATSEFAVDEGDYFSFDEISEFQVLDDRSIVDAALTGLITDNKDFIDSLSK